jgi:hypothetical protein
MLGYDVLELTKGVPQPGHQVRPQKVRVLSESSKVGLSEPRQCYRRLCVSAGSKGVDLAALPVLRLASNYYLAPEQGHAFREGATEGKGFSS